MIKKLPVTALFLFGLSYPCIIAQTPQDVVAALAATVNLTPAPSVTLSWPMPGAGNVLIQRRVKGQGGQQWVNQLNVQNSTQTTFTDNNVQAGLVYEYYLRRTYNNLNAHGYAHVAVEAPVVDQRGKLLLWIDSSLLAPLANELQRLRADLVGDGWQLIERHAGPSSTVASVKAQIVADRTADPINVRAAFLLGPIPIPYSGNTAWDAHVDDHEGAWPADVYYAETNGIWTDVGVDNTVPARPANDNVPGDGKFDQSIVPSPVELQLGRVDFRRLNPAVFGAADHIELYRRYLDKDHAWRNSLYTVENKTLVDDNFGYFFTEAFAANGWRAGSALSGANTVAGDFINNTHPQSCLIAYGCGAGNYQNANGVANSTDFASDTFNAVFTMIFGSYHGDWDYEVNPLLVSALASRGGILTSAWAGRPHWFLHYLASGETIGYCTRETQNGQYNNAYYPSAGESGAHVSLLGDPTLRAHIVAPPAAGAALTGCDPGAYLGWTASPDTTVLGYHVYRAVNFNGPYTCLTPAPIAATSFYDPDATGLSLYHYQIRAVKRQTSPSGGVYFNSSTGLFLLFDASQYQPLVVNAAGGELPCTGACVTLDLQAEAPAGATFQWTGPGGFASLQANPCVNAPGTYTLLVTAPNGCSAEAQALVSLPDGLLLETTATPASATDGTAAVTVQNGSGNFAYLWSNGQTTASISGLLPGAYTVTVTDTANGCTAVAEALVGSSVANDETVWVEQFTVAPNPASEWAEAWLRLTQPAQVEWALLDASGRRVWEQSAGADTPLQAVKIPVSGLANGLYRLQARSGEKIAVRTLAIIR